jgi:hypothetical protein
MFPNYVNEIKARRVIGGSTYNTATSEVLAYASGGDEGNGWEACLYRSRGGAFFEVERTTKSWYDRDECEWKEKSTIDVTPMDHASSVKWCADCEAEIVIDFFALPPEGESNIGEQAARLIRMSKALESDLEAWAKSEGISVNEYVLRAIRERGAQASRATS